MRLHNSIILIVVTMLTVLLIFNGCGTKPAAEEITAERAFIELMQKVPIYYEDLTFWDVEALRSDNDLSEMYGLWKERKAESLEKSFGIKAADIDYLLEAGGLKITKGEFNLEEVRDKIFDYYYHDTSYEDMEVWMTEQSLDPRQGWTGGIVLMEGLFVRGANNYNVEDFIRLVRGEELSMYDKNAAEVLERLPDGIIVLVWRELRLDGLIVAGRSYEKVDDGWFKWTEVYKFESPEDTEEAVEGYFKETEEMFKRMEEAATQRGEPSPCRDFTLEQSGEFVEWSVAIEWIIGLLFYD